jgi:hypothetical protein
MAPTPDQLELLRAMRDRGPIAQFAGEWCFLRERFIVDPGNRRQLLDVITGKTYECPEDVVAMIEGTD